MKKSVLFLIGFILMINFVSAYNQYWGGYNSPMDILDNEWVRFLIVFSIFFATIHFAISKTLKNNVTAGIVALGISLLISMEVYRRGLLSTYSFGSSGLGFWLLVVAGLVVLAFVFKIAYANLKMKGVAGLLAAFWVFFHFSDPDLIYPYDFPYVAYDIHAIAGSWIVGIIVLIFALWALGKSGRPEAR